jgi:hypothetical protein
MTLPFQGGCLCGALRYVCAAEPVVSAHCQCIDCRKDSGTGHCSHMAVPKAAVAISGEAKIFEKSADSGNTVGRAFCPDCGSSVYSVNSAMPDLIFLRASSLDEPDIFKPRMVLYTRNAPAWDHMAPDLPSFETYPPDMGKLIDGV